MERRGFLGRLLGGLVAGVVAKAVKTEAAIPAEVVPVEPALVTVAVDKAEVGEDYSAWTTYTRKAEAKEYPCPDCAVVGHSPAEQWVCWASARRRHLEASRTYHILDATGLTSTTTTNYNPSRYQLVYHNTTSNVTTPVEAWDSRSDWISPQEITFKGIPVFSSQYAPRVYHGVGYYDAERKK